ncbi:hypothetical protein ANO14919_099360 [Xylariales sp. No.14919]|nr:hypothetical protein ANO14919_099360 [Xylariales sp. No.14919]
MQDQTKPGTLAPPELRILASSSTVEVRVIDTNTLIHLNPKLFLQPHIANFTGVYAPDYCFLVSNGERHVLFDLGVRPDWHNYAPRVVSSIDATTTITVGTDVSSMLDFGKSGLGIRSKDIEAAIWSHNHFDHIGDMSRFPGTTRLVVGPGVRVASWPGYPSNPDSLVLDADAEGRVVQELSFQSHDPQQATPFRIGRFDAFDYFGDGSFYLLNAPGYAVGHLCGLA